MKMNDIKKLDGKIISVELFEALECDTNVNAITTLGNSGFIDNATWWDVNLTDGSCIDIYTAKEV